VSSQSELVVHGSGMMASAIRSAKGIRGAVFAAGVSNSLETNEASYAREARTLREFIDQHTAEKIIYFSSYVAAAGESRYARHKRDQEDLIAQYSRDFLVLRLPQVVGQTANRTLISYLVHAARTGAVITIQKRALRSLVDVHDVGRITSLLTDKNVRREVIAVGPPKPMTILEIVEKIESVLSVKIHYKLTDEGERQWEDLARLIGLLDPCDPLFDESYQNSVLEKYVPSLFAGTASRG